MKYEPEEILITVEPIGSKRKGTLIPVGTEVQFFKVNDASDLSCAMLAFKYDDRIIVTKETNVKPKNKRKIKKAFTAFDKQMMVNNPRLRRYHPNLFLRMFYKALYFFKDLRGKK